MRFMRLNMLFIMALLCGGFAVAGEEAPQDQGGHVMSLAGMMWDKDDDVAFLSAMVAHHQGALDMADKVVGATKDPVVKKWANDIITSQSDEIKRMQTMLDAAGKRDDEAAGMMEKAMKEMLTVKESEDPDMNFAMLMIPHHAGAIEMSLPALVLSDNAGIRKLAGEIIAAQTKEIGEFKDWIDVKKGMDHK